MRKKITLLLLALLSFAGTAKADVEWTIWEGSYTFNNEGSSNGLELSNCFAILEAGDNLKFELSVTGGADYQQMYLAESYSENTLVQKNWETITGNFSQEVTSDIYSYLVTNSGKMTISGKGYTLTKVAISKAKSYIRSYLNDGSAKIENLNGTGKSVPNANYNYTVAGDYIYLDLSNVDSEIWVGLNGNGSSNIINSNFKNPYFKALTDDDVTNLKAGYGYLQCSSGITIKSASLLHPVNSFSIGSIGYATFSASQQVTAPASVTAYKATISGDNSYVSLTPFTNNVIPENTGAIIAGDEGAVLEFTASSESTSETSDLVACTADTDVSTLNSGYDYYVLYNNLTGGNTYFGLGDSDLNTKWGDGTTYSNKVITFTESWKGCGWYLTANYSNYSKVVVEFESATTSGGRLVVDYDNNNTSYTDFTTGATSVEVTFDEEKKSSVKQIYFTSETASATFTLSSAYIVSNAGSQKAEFRKTTSGTLAANKAYLKVTSGSGGARTLNISFGENDGTTGISEMPVAQKKVEDNIYYNLQGQRVSNPGKGLFIVNGKKVFIK